VLTGWAVFYFVRPKWSNPRLGQTAKSGQTIRQHFRRSVKVNKQKLVGRRQTPVNTSTDRQGARSLTTIEFTVLESQNYTGDMSQLDVIGD